MLRSRYVETNPEILRLRILSREALLEMIYVTQGKKCFTKENSEPVNDAMLIMSGIGDEEKNYSAKALNP